MKSSRERVGEDGIRMDIRLIDIRLIVTLSLVLFCAATPVAGGQDAKTPVKIGMIATDDDPVKDAQNGTVNQTLGTGNDAFFSVSGSFARAWLGNFLVQDEANSSEGADGAEDLWSWGGTPRGKALLGGDLVSATNLSERQDYRDWLGVFPPSYEPPVDNETDEVWVPPF